MDENLKLSEKEFVVITKALRCFYQYHRICVGIGCSEDLKIGDIIMKLDSLVSK